MQNNKDTLYKHVNMFASKKRGATIMFSSGWCIAHIFDLYKFVFIIWLEEGRSKERPECLNFYIGSDCRLFIRIKFHYVLFLIPEKYVFSLMCPPDPLKNNKCLPQQKTLMYSLRHSHFVISASPVLG